MQASRAPHGLLSASPCGRGFYRGVQPVEQRGHSDDAFGALLGLEAIKDKLALRGMEAIERGLNAGEMLVIPGIKLPDRQAYGLVHAGGRSDGIGDRELAEKRPRMLVVFIGMVSIVSGRILQIEDARQKWVS